MSGGLKMEQWRAVEAHNEGVEAQNGAVGALYTRCLPDSHHFYEEQDPDPQQSEKRDPDPHQVRTADNIFY